MSTPFNQPSLANPQLSDLFDTWKRDIFLSLNCHAIATVQKFDRVALTVSATINYSKSYLQLQPNGKYITVLVDYPILLDCPAIILGGGGGSISFPIGKGDQCLILFNDRDIDNWFSGASVGELATNRLHSFSDGIALVGLNKVSDYDSTRAVLKYNGSAMVGVGEELIKISNDMFTLRGLLEELIDAIKDITVAPGTFSNGAGAVTGLGAISSTSKTALDGVSNDIEGLLE